MQTCCTYTISHNSASVKRNSSQPDQAGKHSLLTAALPPPSLPAEEKGRESRGNGKSRRGRKRKGARKNGGRPWEEEVDEEGEAGGGRIQMERPPPTRKY